MTSKERRAVVEKFKYCVNCLAQSHTLGSCTSRKTCFKCQRHHHTLLHPNAARTQRKQRKPKKNTTATATQPDTRILSEAIKSLAAVLCSSHNVAQVQGGRHVQK
ncbi:uncharacterized protein LOC142229999 [Haematobia irritans]|uniref:uncharacterized protein LOC142229999 n=1 Tax=Haematobia irritans TaxID=7368 RepID=UPI003F4FC124